jgi:hypothetical protein
MRSIGSSPSQAEPQAANCLGAAIQFSSSRPVHHLPGVIVVCSPNLFTRMARRGASRAHCAISPSLGFCGCAKTHSCAEAAVKRTWYVNGPPASSAAAPRA